MRNLAKIFAVVSIAATFSFAQYEAYEDTENNEPWPTEEQSDDQEEASEATEAEQKDEAKDEKLAAKDTVQKAEEDDAVSRVLAQKRARDAARKEEEKRRAESGEGEMSAIDQTTSRDVKKATAGIGIRSDFILGNFWGTSDLEDGIDEPSGYGFDVGITARFEMLDILWFTPEILFEAYWLEQDDETFNREFNQMNLTVPLMFRAILPFYDRIYFEVGPQFSLNLSNEVKFDTDHSELHVPGSDIVIPNTFAESEIEQTIFSVGVTLGLGFYIIPERLALNVRFYAGLTELFPDAKSELSDRDDNRVMVDTKLMGIKFGLNFWIL